LIETWKFSLDLNGYNLLCSWIVTSILKKNAKKHNGQTLICLKILQLSKTYQMECKYILACNQKALQPLIWGDWSKNHVSENKQFDTKLKTFSLSSTIS
jgi:hypothetical protein